MTPPIRTQGYWYGLGLGLSITALVLVIGVVFGQLWVKRASHDAREGWNLKPVVVVGEDLRAGATLVVENLSQRFVPEQFVTDSVVRPDRADEVVGRRLKATMEAGDPLLWSQLEPAETPRVLIANRDLAVGTVLGAEHVEVRSAPPEVVTPSWVGEAQLREVTGAVLLTPIHRGDPILTTQLKLPAPEGQ